ncbi:hypothetical protein NDN16_11335 [Aureimonas altamirensis]|uniref:hypothetical protein n=1 Tax=Aureimonas altamirensis TaxID=370622 RepID=UPI00203713AB|nr:hypothetical protein [Aureimonas altamirensis]MCM2504265.1 hypothetical protein [Aureimonas altamirensis]
MIDTQRLVQTGLDKYNGYLVVQHGVGVHGAYGDELLSQAEECVALGTLMFVAKFRHRDDNTWVSLFQRIDHQSPSRPIAFIEPADKRAV